VAIFPWHPGFCLQPCDTDTGCGFPHGFCNNPRSAGEVSRRLNGLDALAFPYTESIPHWLASHAMERIPSFPSAWLLVCLPCPLPWFCCSAQQMHKEKERFISMHLLCKACAILCSGRKKLIVQYAHKILKKL
jgi:hypothetical protein